MLRDRQSKVDPFRTLVVTPCALDDSLGGGQRTAAIVRALAPLGPVDVLVTAAPPAPSPSRTAEHHAARIVYAQPGAPWARLLQPLVRLLTVTFLPAGLVRPREVRLALRDLIGRVPYSVIITRYARSLEVAGRPHSSLVVLDVDDIEYQRRLAIASFGRTALARGTARFRAFLSKRLLLNVARRAHAIWVVKGDDTELFPHREVSLVPNAAFTVPAGRTAPLRRPPGDAPSLLFVGHFAYTPNIAGVNWFLSEVWDRILRAREDCRFLIAGRCSDGPLVARWSATRNVEYLGYVPDLADAYARCWISVNPQRFGAGTNIKVIESMAYGRVVVSTRYGSRGWQHAVDQAGCPLVADTASGFADLCIRWLQDDKGRARLESAAFGYAQEFGTAATFERLVRERVSASLQSQPS